jgi:hypothetical protein
MSCHVCPVEAADTKQNKHVMNHMGIYRVCSRHTNRHPDKRRDEPAAAKKLLLNKRLNIKARSPSIPEACRSPCLREPLIFAAFCRQPVSYTYSPHTRHPHPHTRYRASCTPCRPDDHGRSIASLQHAGTRGLAANQLPRLEKPALYRALLWQGIVTCFALVYLLVLEVIHGLRNHTHQG